MPELCRPAISEHRLADSRENQAVILCIHKVQLDGMANAASAVDGHHVGHGVSSASRDPSGSFTIPSGGACFWVLRVHCGGTRSCKVEKIPVGDSRVKRTITQSRVGSWCISQPQGLSCCRIGSCEVGRCQGRLSPRLQPKTGSSSPAVELLRFPPWKFYLVLTI